MIATYNLTEVPEEVLLSGGKAPTGEIAAGRFLCRRQVTER
jgi:hypothetical protein